MPKIVLLVGPPGSGKSTLANMLEVEGSPKMRLFCRVSQDDQGKDHLKYFRDFIAMGADIVVDRMNFSKGQRDRYLASAEEAGYDTEIIVLHESYDTCLARCLKREGHPTIKDEANARSALNTFFSKYERVQDSEADKVTRIWPEGEKPPVVICDLDGTLCDVDHRLHFMKPVEGKKKNWPGFFGALGEDTPNLWCEMIIDGLMNNTEVIFCSGRPDNYRKQTQAWLEKYNYSFNKLFMRNRHDSRRDDIAKEIILDFEILTRWKPLFAIDDRKQVVDMWRRRGIVCLACAEGNF